MLARRTAFALALVAALAATATAQERRGRPAANAEQQPAGPGVLSLLPSDAVSEHTLEAGGTRLAYTATVGTLTLYDQSGERTAAIVYTAYVLKDRPAESRPVTFAFNGGPGAASAYLHLGLVGPKILEFGAGGRDGATARLRDNPETWLAFTDLVMIDPIGTGWSRAAKADDAKNFYGIGPDAQTLAKTIALYLAKNGRLQSPKYLLGESYGGFRSVKVARALQNEQSIIVSGIIMVSPLIEGALQFGADRFPLGAALQLPSVAASELELRHAFSAEAIAAAERFAMTEYLTTLAGAAPQGEAARKFYGRVAEISGLPLDVVTRSRGFIRDAYVKHLGRDKKIVSPYVATFAAPDAFPESDRSGADPILDGVTRAYGSAFVGYARDELGFKTDITYLLLARDISGRWDWKGEHGRSPVSAESDLRELLALNPSFRILVTHGYSDLVIPYSVSRYVVDHLPPLGSPDRVQLKLYKGGHMMYMIASSRIAMTADARTFYGAPSQ